ncbi:unnamed protein product [Cyclocybe aegerita]|uniref:Uncharacterized protein n=1 Tax=Cyclocybe aegerita TaxID=1973307 RepID=A0A8S0W044_CYCAE|nr:unnamed protein product [Cyclocybe aegerita]
MSAQNDSTSPIVDGVTHQPYIPYIVAFDIIHIAGLIIIGSTVLTAWLSPRIRRGPMWFMFEIAWLSAPIGHLLLLGQQTGPPPSTGYCLFQATFVYGTPVFYAWYACSFMLHVYLSLRRTMGGYAAMPKKYSALFHILPCSVFFLIVLEVVIYGLLHKSSVERDPSGMYCNIRDRLPNKITAGFSIVPIIPLLVIEVLVYRAIRHHTWREAGKTNWRNADHLTPEVVMRVLIFGVCPIGALIIGILQYFAWDTDHGGAELNLGLAMLPTLVGLIFGTQKDILRVWMFWKKDTLTSSSSVVTL